MTPINLYFENAVADIKPGPKWLHQIAMVDYDYMSDGGKGWFNDIDALTQAISKKVPARKSFYACTAGMTG